VLYSKVVAGTAFAAAIRIELACDLSAQAIAPHNIRLDSRTVRGLAKPERSQC
jgi:hypothetical protein